MNRSMIIYILGWILKIEALLMLMPCVVAVIYGESAGVWFLVSLLLCGSIGLLLSWKKPVNTMIYLKEGCITTALSWIFLSFFGCLPFWFSREIPAFEDALFETISGFTTTGASILSDVESLSHCILIWRSFTHWIGGMGVLVFLLAVVPLSGGANMNLMRAESPGPSVGKLVPKVKHTARILYLIYVGLTVAMIFFLLIGGMPLFDSVATAVGTAGTGGFGIKNDSIGGYSAYLQWVTTVFMILFGVNFNAYYYILYRKWKSAFEMEEVRGYFLIIGSAIALIVWNIYTPAYGFAHALRDAAFQVGSIITTTGFSTADFDQWPQTARTILVMLMFVGACAGSTGGGIKISRFQILLKTIRKEMNSFLHPKSVKKIKMDGKPIEHEVVRATNVFLITFVMLFAFSVFILSFEETDLLTNFTAIAATINNIGPGLNQVGPTCNFGSFSVLSKFVMMFDMLAGRLELFPMLLLFYPPLWKEIVAKKGNKKH